MQRRCLPAFRSTLGPLLGELEADLWPAFGIADPDVLAYVNPAWGDPDLWPLGTSIRAALGPLRDPFLRTLDRARRCGRASLPYECPTPTERRRFLAEVLRLCDGYAVRNHLLVAEPAPGSSPLPVERYRQPTGDFVQCANCRRTLEPTRRSWEWVPDLVELGRPEIGYRLCPTCIEALEPR